MKTATLTLAATVIATFIASAAMAHPSLHHTGQESWVHDALTILPFVAVGVAGFFALKLGLAKK